MKFKCLCSTICLFLLITLLISCSPSQPTAEEQTQPAVSATVPPAAPPTETVQPTEEGFQIPNGMLLAYTNLAEGGGQYSIITLPDLTIEPYTPLNSEEWFVDWSSVLSPDAHFLAYRRSVNQEYSVNTLYLLNIETGESTRISDYSQSNGMPTWTADGRYLEFDNLDQGLFIYDTQTGSLREINTSSDFADSSAISPAGDRIAYSGGCPGLGIPCPVDLYVINTDGSGETYLEQGDIDWIFWSADGSRIYYSLFGKRETYGYGDSGIGGYQLYYYDFKTGQSTLIDDPRFHTEANSSTFLSPDGQFLAYSFGDAGLKVVRTSDFSQVAFLEPGNPAWAPDSRYLAANSWEGNWYLFDVQTGETIDLDLDLQSSTIVGWLP